MSRQRLIDYGVFIGAMAAASVCFFMVWHSVPVLVEIIVYGSWYDYFGFVVLACFGFLAVVGVCVAAEGLSQVKRPRRGVDHR